MKKILLLAFLPLMAQADPVEIDGIYYNLNNTSLTAEITVPNNCSGVYSGEVTIPSTVTYDGNNYSVTTIGKWAFLGCDDLASVTIPNSVTSIGIQAFRECGRLTSISIPNSVTSIGDEAFGACSALTSITIPGSVTDIGKFAFDGTAWYDNQPNGLVYAGKVAYGYKGTMPTNTNITLEEGTKGIAGMAFMFCIGLTSVTIPNSLITIGECAFYGCSGLTSVTIPEGMISIGDQAFEECSGLTSINIPNSVTSIGNGAFNGCNSLQSVTLSNSLTTIGENAFQYCIGLTSITIPKSVTSISWGPFGGCSGLASIVVEDGNPFYDSRNNCNAIIETATGKLIQGCKNTIIPENVTSIGEKAFFGCSDLTSITIPSSVTSILWLAFTGCDNLSEVTSYIENPFYLDYGEGRFNVHDDVLYTTTLYVPAGTKELYQEMPGWRFNNIVEMESAPKVDFNEDSKMDVTDVVTLINCISKNDFTGISKEAADVNGDGEVNVTDVVTLILMIAKAK